MRDQQDPDLHEAHRASGNLGRAKLKYRAKSAEGKVRHTFFKVIREDSEECILISLGMLGPRSSHFFNERAAV